MSTRPVRETARTGRERSHYERPLDNFPRLVRSQPRQNRVTPWGELIADPARGALMGNRGVLHDDEGRIVRSYQIERWITCLLEYKGRRRELMRPGYYTELFFWDEATALAAGHRPCAECRRERFEEFQAAWVLGNGARNGLPLASEIDRDLHRERITADGRKRTFPATLSEVPDGAFVVYGNEACLVWEGELWPWTPGGYREPVELDPLARVPVLTPEPTVAVIAAGYVPEVRLPERVAEHEAAAPEYAG